MDREGFQDAVEMLSCSELFVASFSCYAPIKLGKRSGISSSLMDAKAMTQVQQPDC